MKTGSATEWLRVGLQVQTIDGKTIGQVTDVWPDVGVGESWGAVGSFPHEGAEASDPAKYDYSEAMPGEGDSYFCADCPGEGKLYVPFSAIFTARDGMLVLAVEADDVPHMQWDVVPDFLNLQNVAINQAGPHKA